MQKKTIILIAAAVVLALLGIVGVNQVVYQEKQKVVAGAKAAIQTMQANQAAVLVAKKSIAKGAMVTPDMIDVSIVPKDYIQPQAVTSADRIAGMMAVMPIEQGDQITLSKLTFPKSSGALSDVTPRGKRAISVQVDNMASLSGMIKAGDYVDVIALIAIPLTDKSGKTVGQPSVIPLFQNVLVLAVGRDVGGAAQAARRYQKEESSSAEANAPITLALTSQEASIVAFVQEQGRIRLILRSPSDSEVEPMQITSWDVLFRYLVPPDKQQEQAAAAQAQAEAEATAAQKAQASTGYVEVYRGMNKDKMQLSQ
ncbi:MAG TPA: Flp pilus assembly protein CpaB [Candidatus Omnitrophota bacterium]|nr:Flp pilus assembly protein CpaB [Candidatus Omnitrophota bacterium]HPT07092.1 Flp pilus assembly protein CpaB [Candidatus Omnitrophota bacterium]